MKNRKLKVKVYFDANDWFSNTKEFLEWFKKYTPGNSGKWGDLYLTPDKYSADVVVCFGNKVSKIRDSNTVIQIRREPDYIQKFMRSPLADIVIDYENNYHVASWFIKKDFDYLNNLSYHDFEKQNNCSAIFSSKHENRNKIMKKLSSHSNCDVHFYGRGIAGILFDRNQYYGELNDNGVCKYKGLVNYQKSIAIENSSQKNYFTEKLIDCFVCNTLPIYWGCPNIFDYFPEKSIRVIKNSDSIDDIMQKIKQPVTDEEINSLKIAKELVMNEYNIWPAIQKAIDTYVNNDIVLSNGVLK